jgi:hypothetical protein
MATLHPAVAHRRAGRRAARIGLHIGEGRLRQAAALVVLLAQVVGAIGLAWDIQWHISVGRDRFLTPPHLLLYTSVSLTGLVCLLVVLLDTWRWRLGIQVDHSNTITLFGVFHAPLGFAVAGFGALVVALAAPLDNYWHELYGIDVALWAPFHTMGSLGGCIGLLGMLYAWSSLLVHERRRGAQTSGVTEPGEQTTCAPGLSVPAWGFLATLMLLIGSATVQARPALFTSPTLWVVRTEIALYPVLLALFVPWLFVVARCVLGRRTGPLLLLGLWSAFTLGLMVLIPRLVQAGAAAEGLPIRSLSLWYGLTQLSTLQMLAIGMVGSALTLLLWRWPVSRAPAWPTTVLTGTLAGIAVWLASAAVVSFAAGQVGLVASAGLPVARTVASPTSLALALPCSILAAIASVALGANLAQVLQRSPR